MRAMTFVLSLLLPFSLQAFNYTGDEALHREAALTIQTLAAHGFPEPESVALKEGRLILSFDGQEVQGALPAAGGTLVETLIGVELAHWGPSVPAPLASAARAYLSARTRGGEWSPRSLDEALLQAFVLELVKNDPEQLAGLLESVGRGESWTGAERYFAFRYGLTPEAFFSRCVARTLPHLLPFLEGIPSAAVRDGETEFVLAGAPPLAASTLELRFPAVPDTGLALAWDGGLLPSPALLLVLYGPPLDHFDLVDLGNRADGLTLPLAGAARLILLSTSAAFARPAGEPLTLRGTLAENYPCKLKHIDLHAEEEGASLSFDAESMADVAAFVVLRGFPEHPGRLEAVGFLPGLGRAADPFAFTLVDPEMPSVQENHEYHLYAITADGLMAHQGTLPLYTK